MIIFQEKHSYQSITCRTMVRCPFQQVVVCIRLLDIRVRDDLVNDFDYCLCRYLYLDTHFDQILHIFFNIFCVFITYIQFAKFPPTTHSSQLTMRLVCLTIIIHSNKYRFSISIYFSTYTNYNWANTTILQFVDTKIGVYIYLTFVSAISSTKAIAPI